MPLYEYHCDPCDRRFETIRPLSRRDEAAPCPTCEAPCERMLSAFAVGAPRSSSAACGQVPAADCGGGG